MHTRFSSSLSSLSSLSAFLGLALVFLAASPTFATPTTLPAASSGNSQKAQPSRLREFRQERSPSQGRHEVTGLPDPTRPKRTSPLLLPKEKHLLRSVDAKGEIAHLYQPSPSSVGRTKDGFLHVRLEGDGRKSSYFVKVVFAESPATSGLVPKDLVARTFVLRIKKIFFERRIPKPSWLPHPMGGFLDYTVEADLLAVLPPPK